jgi:hypothetical protein
MRRSASAPESSRNIEPFLRHQVGKRLRLKRHRRDEEPDDIEIQPLDAAGFLTAAVGFEQRRVEVAFRRQRCGCGAYRSYLIGATGARQHGDAVSTVHQALCDGQQWADVPDG